MEELNNIEGSNALKNHIFETYEKEGDSENLQIQIDEWVRIRQGELDRGAQTVEARNGLLNIELAEIYIRVKNLEKTQLTLDHLWMLAENLDSDFLRQEVNRLVESM